MSRYASGNYRTRRLRNGRKIYKMRSQISRRSQTFSYITNITHSAGDNRTHHSYMLHPKASFLRLLLPSSRIVVPLELRNRPITRLGCFQPLVFVPRLPAATPKWMLAYVTPHILFGAFAVERLLLTKVPTARRTVRRL